MSGVGPEAEVPIEVTLDPAQARRIAEQLSTIMEQAFTQAARASQAAFAQAFTGGGVRRAAQQVNQALNQATKGTQAQVGSLANGMQQLIARAAALRSELSDRGLNPNIFASYDAALASAIDKQEEFNRRRIELENDPDVLAAFEASSRNINNALRTEVRIGTNILQQEHGRRIVAEQRSLTESNTATRLNLARQLAAEQSSSRARIELFRFTARQIQFIETQLARALRATANAAASAVSAGFRGIGAVVRSLRRNNAEFNEGLQGALSRRERAMSESFNRQNRTIQQQSQVIERFNKQASGGLFGILSGRSAAANALGITGILGGGFAAGNLLGQGLERFTTLERIQIQLERLTESASRTRIIMKDLIDLARETPLELTDVSTAAVGLLSAGTGLKDLIPFVRALADAIGFTGGGAEQLQRVALAIRQIASKGRLQGEEIRQLAESLPGLNIPQLLADQLTGGDSGLLLKMSEAGEISAKEFIGAFFAAIQGDKRIVGAATATVNTLGGQIAILKESFATLGESIIRAIEPLLLFSIRGTTRRLEFFSDLIKGDVSPNLLILRKALIGVAAGIGALLVARAAGESLQFLAIGLRAVLSPMGIIVAAAAALGAAFILLRSNAEAWAAVSERVGKALADMVPFLDVNGNGFVTLSEVIQGRLLPALSALANIAKTVLLNALRVGLGFIVTVVVPGLAFLANLIVNTIVPGIVSLAQAVANRATPVLRILVGVLGDVVEFLGPAVRGFRDLGGAIGDAFKGDFSGIADQLKSIGPAQVAAAAGLGGIGALIGGPIGATLGATIGLALGGSLQDLGAKLITIMRPQLERVVDFVSDALGKIDPEAAVRAIANVAHRIGFVLGNIVTDPSFLQALEKIALAGALIAGRFIQGFAEGVASNLPQLSRIFADQFFDVLLLALRTVFSSPQALLAVITAALVGPIAIRAFKNVGTNWGKLTSDGFTTGLKRGSRNIVAGVRGFFADAGDVQRRATEKIQRDTLRQYNRLARNIAAIGGTIPPVNVTDVGAIQRMQAAFNQASRGIDDATRRALIARSQFSDIFRGAEIGARTSAAAIGKVFGRTGSTWQDIRLGFRAAKNNLVAGFGDLARDMKARGAPIGQTLGTGILGGIAAAFAGQQGGKAGILGIVTAAITTGLATGSPLVGAAVGGIGLISLALHEAKVKAEEFSNAVRGIIDTFDDLSSADTIAEDLASNLATAFTAKFESSDALDILKSLPDGFLATFADAAVQGQIIGGADAFVKLSDAIGVSRTEVEGLRDAFNQPGEVLLLTDLDKQLQQLQTRQVTLQQMAATDPASAAPQQLERVKAQIAAIQALQEEVEKGGISLDLFGQFVGFLTDQVEINGVAVNTQAERQRVLTKAVDETTASYGRSITAGRATADALERTSQAAGQTGNAFLDALKFIPKGFQVTEGFLRQLYEQLVRTGGALLSNFDFERWIQGWKSTTDQIDRGNDAVSTHIDLLEELADVQTVDIDLFGLVRSAIEEVNKARTDKINQRITFLQDQLEGAQDAAKKARDELTKFLTGRFQDTPQRLVDELIGSLGDIGSAVEDSLIQGGVRGAAGMRVAVGGFEQQLANIIQAGFESGLTTQGEFEALLSPLFSGLDEEAQDALARILSTEDFDVGVGGPAADKLREAISRALADGQIEANIQGIFDADANVARIQRELDFQRTELDVELRVDAEQVKDALARAGIDPRILADITGATVTQAQVEGLAAVVAAVNAQLNGQPTPGTITINQDVNTQIDVSGAQTPTATAAEIVTQQGVIAGGAIAPVLGQVGFMRT